MSRDLLSSRRCQFTRVGGHEGGGHIHMFQHLKLTHITQPGNGHTGLEDPLAAAAAVAAAAAAAAAAATQCERRLI